MSSYIIDYETASLGHIEKGKLASGDRAFVFYQNEHTEIPSAAPICLTSNHAMIRYIKITAKSTNAISHVISSYIGYLIASGTESNITVITGDTSIDTVIEFWRTTNPQISVKRVAAAAKAPHDKKQKKASPDKKINSDAPKSKGGNITKGNASPASSRNTEEKSKVETKRSCRDDSAKGFDKDKCKKLRVKLRAIGLDEPAFSKFLTIYTKAKSKQELNISLVRAFTQETGNKIYKSIVKDFDKLTSRKSDSDK